jgi:SAM-dependent methyltransferase
MPDIVQNVEQWAANSVWVEAGDDWSSSWGGAEKQWNGCVFPRIQRFLPTQSILEIAPGFGRWTQFLRSQCDQLTAVDLSSNCVEACKKRFGDFPQLSFYQNDGKSLDMVPDGSVDFIFSFDSLVHADAEAIDAYLSQFKRILKPEGAAFIHHSNYGAHVVSKAVMALGHIRGLRRLVWGLRLGGIQPNRHWRSENMSAARFRELCPAQGLSCVEQELVNWGSDFLNDCFSILVRDDSAAARAETVITENMHFMDEATRIKLHKPGTLHPIPS